MCRGNGAAAMRRDLQNRVERLESNLHSSAVKPWVNVGLVESDESEAEAYQRVTGSPYPSDPSTLPHNVIFRVIV